MCDSRSGCVPRPALRDAGPSAPDGGSDAGTDVGLDATQDALWQGLDGGSRTTACAPFPMPPFVRDCATAVPTAGDGDGDGIPDRDDFAPGNCNALVSWVDPSTSPIAWSDPGLPACTWGEGDATSGIAELLGLDPTGADVMVRASFSLDLDPAGAAAGLFFTSGAGTVWCTVQAPGGGALGLHIGPSPTSGGTYGVPPFASTRQTVVMTLTWGGSFSPQVDCRLSDRTETSTFALVDTTTLSVGPASFGFGVVGAGAQATLQYLAVFRGL